MLRSTVVNIVRWKIYTSTRIFSTFQNTLKYNFKQSNLYVNSSYQQQNCIILKRLKSKGRTSKHDEYEEEEDENDIEIDDYLNTQKSKIIERKVPSLRLDVIAKAGLGISRSKLDKEFYSSNLRINGKKCLKKSMLVQVGDEVDHIQNRSPTNPDYLIIDRCVLLSSNLDLETNSITIKLVQNKSLLVEKYSDM